MTEKKPDALFEEQYEYGFKNEDVSIFSTGKGLNESVVRAISKAKEEPEWMLEFRLKALKAFEAMPMPKFGPSLEGMDFDSYTYFTRVSKGESSSWEDIPETVKKTFQKLGIPEAEQKFLSGVSTQYESEVVYHNMLEEVREKALSSSLPKWGFASFPISLGSISGRSSRSPIANSARSMGPAGRAAPSSMSPKASIWISLCNLISASITRKADNSRGH
jgi:hypothetical protein